MISLSKPIIGEDEKQAVMRVLDSGMIAQGPEVEAFENEFSSLVSDHHCVAVNSGTSALHLGLLAAGVESGDEVIIPSFTFAATANAVSLCGATPVFVDIDIDTFTVNPEAVNAAITGKTSAIMPVHLYGHPARMDSISEICEKNGLLLLEDAAQAHLATFQSKPVGTFGTTAFSFYPTKNMTSGEGGMIVTSDSDIARKAKLLRNQGMEKQYENEIVGFNNRMTDIHAAIGRVQLANLRDRTAMRKKNAEYFNRELDTVTTPFTHHDASHVYHQYTIRTNQRESLIELLIKEKI
ncbi:MAG: DegT/DnrJ/EryC1/StrS family aminotransferase, partial [Acidimicrobiales bacterium]|nr:DegT/DnrJ/EryC1/StrS family aminotransferase [Acidimicrobiales bacterium]